LPESILPESPLPEPFRGPLVGPRWQVESIAFPGIAEAATFRNPVWIQFSPDGTIVVQTQTCQYTDLRIVTLAPEGNIETGLGPATEGPFATPCPDDFLGFFTQEALENSTRYLLNGTHLTLEDDESSVVLQLDASASREAKDVVEQASPAPAATESPVPIHVSGTWRVQSFAFHGIEKPLVLTSPAWVELSLPEMRSWAEGCNITEYSIRRYLDTGKYEVPGFRAPNRSCPLHFLHRLLASAIYYTNTITVEGNTVHLSGTAPGVDIALNAESSSP